MPPNYRALLIGNSTFPDDPQNLPDLDGPVKDIALLLAALTHPTAGLFAQFDVRTVLERTKREILVDLEAFFGTATRDDLLLLYYSGHGVLTFDNRLQLCGRDTVLASPRATAVTTADLNSMIDNSAARTTVIVLDCCHSGSYKGSGGMPEDLGGVGRFVLMSCGARQLALGAGRRNGISLFTRHVVDGLLGATGDRDGDGYADLVDVYDYVYQRLEEDKGPLPKQDFAGQGNVRIARRLPPATPEPLRIVTEQVSELPPPLVIDLADSSAPGRIDAGPSPDESLPEEPERRIEADKPPVPPGVAARPSPGESLREGPDERVEAYDPAVPPRVDPGGSTRWPYRAQPDIRIDPAESPAPARVDARGSPTWPSWKDPDGRTEADEVPVPDRQDWRRPGRAGGVGAVSLHRQDSPGGRAGDGWRGPVIPEGHRSGVVTVEPPPDRWWTPTRLAVTGAVVAMTAVLTVVGFFVLREKGGTEPEPEPWSGLQSPEGIALDGKGAAFVVDSGRSTVFRVDLESGDIGTLFTADAEARFEGVGEPEAVDMQGLHAVVVDGDGDIVFGADGRIYRGSADGQTLSFVPLLNTPFEDPIVRALTFDRDGALLAAVAGDVATLLLRVGAGGTTEWVAGDGQETFQGDNLPAAESSFAAAGIAVDSDGSILIADNSNHRVRRVDGDGIIRAFAGNGDGVHAGDGDDALLASVESPLGVAVRNGKVYVADAESVRVISDGTINTLAGKAGETGDEGDGGPANEATLDCPTGIAVDDDFVYVTDSANHRVRKIDLESGVIHPVG